jgi:hypothetical protein
MALMSMCISSHAFKAKPPRQGNCAQLYLYTVMGSCLGCLWGPPKKSSRFALVQDSVELDDEFNEDLRQLLLFDTNVVKEEEEDDDDKETYSVMLLRDSVIHQHVQQ